MFPWDFDHNVLPELHYRASDFNLLNQKYLNLNNVSVANRFFDDPRFILPKCPENGSDTSKRISAFMKTMMDVCVAKNDFRKYPIICFTH
jgi:hypothetical protein